MPRRRRTQLAAGLPQAPAWAEETELLFRFALGRCRDPELARDAVQEACLRLLEADRDGSPVLSRQAWMRKVVENFLFDDARRASRTVALGQAGPACGLSQPEEPEQPLRLPGSLTPREADCVRLRLGGHRYREIAERLGLHPGTVARLLARAAAKLRGPRQAAGSPAPAEDVNAAARASCKGTSPTARPRGRGGPTPPARP